MLQTDVTLVVRRVRCTSTRRVGWEDSPKKSVETGLCTCFGRTHPLIESWEVGSGGQSTYCDLLETVGKNLVFLVGRLGIGLRSGCFSPLHYLTTFSC